MLLEVMAPESDVTPVCTVVSPAPDSVPLRIPPFSVLLPEELTFSASSPPDCVKLSTNRVPEPSIVPPLCDNAPIVSSTLTSSVPLVTETSPVISPVLVNPPPLIATLPLIVPAFDPLPANARLPFSMP